MSPFKDTILDLLEDFPPYFIQKLGVAGHTYCAALEFGLPAFLYWRCVGIISGGPFTS